MTKTGQDNIITEIESILLMYAFKKRENKKKENKSENKTILRKQTKTKQNTYRIAGNFQGVLIFVIFVTNLLVTKSSTHENF